MDLFSQHPVTLAHESALTNAKAHLFSCKYLKYYAWLTPL